MIKAGFVAFAVGLGVVLAVLVGSQSARDETRRLAAARRAQAGDTRDPSTSGDDFRPVRELPMAAAVIEPAAVPAGQMSGLDGSELVVGLVINGQARAYPVNFISEPKHEIVNDVLGGAEIAVTWCEHCSNGVVFERRVDGKPLTLQVAGMLWRDNMVMVDETGTLWSQLLGRAMSGPRRGKSLRSIPFTLTDWKSWKRRHPDTTVADLDRTSTKFRRSFLSGTPDLYLGVVSSTTARAWQLKSLAAISVLNDWVGGAKNRRDPGGMRRGGPIQGRDPPRPVVAAYLQEDGTIVVRSRRLSGRVLTFELNGRGEIVDRETGSVWDLLSGKAVSGELAGRTLALLPATLVRLDTWRRFRPDSTYWEPAATHRR